MKLVNMDLKVFRAKHGLTQMQLAEVLCVGIVNYRFYEKLKKVPELWRLALKTYEREHEREHEGE